MSDSFYLLFVIVSNTMGMAHAKIAPMLGTRKSPALIPVTERADLGDFTDVLSSPKQGRKSSGNLQCKAQITFLWHIYFTSDMYSTMSHSKPQNTVHKNAKHITYTMEKLHNVPDFNLLQ